MTRVLVGFLDGAEPPVGLFAGDGLEDVHPARLAARVERGEEAGEHGADENDHDRRPVERDPVDEFPEINTAVRPDRFGRLFDLEPFAQPTPKIIAALKQLGAPGGIMDAADDLAAGPLGLILNPGPNRDNTTHTAGMTFIGQFIDHDLTLDATSPLRRRDRAGAHGQPAHARVRSGLGVRVRPVRRPGALRGRQAAAEGRARAGAYEDVPRMPDGTPLIGDARNDENMAVNGIHAAFLRFHNKLLENGVARDFKSARKLVTWHWQWIVLNEFLPLTIGASETAELLSTRKLFKKFPDPFIPVEFQGASYRFGHSPGPPVLPRELHRRPRRRPEVRVRVRRDADRRRRPDRHAGRDARRRPAHRLADVLPLRRRRPRGVHAAEQDDRHEALEPAVPPAAEDGPRPRGRARARRSATCCAT